MFLASTSYLEYQIMGWGDHDLHILEEKIFPTYSVWAFQKGTVWRYQFDKYAVVCLVFDVLSSKFFQFCLYLHTLSELGDFSKYIRLSDVYSTI